MISNTLQTICLATCFFTSFICNVVGIIYTSQIDYVPLRDPTMILATLNLIYLIALFTGRMGWLWNYVSFGLLVVNILSISMWPYNNNPFLRIIPVSSIVCSMAFIGEMILIAKEYLFG